MKTIITKFFAIALSVLLLSSSYAFAGNTNTVGANAVTSVYDYSNFAAAGSFTSIADPVNNSVTHVYSNARISGYTGTDGKFIATNTTTLYSNGAAHVSHNTSNGANDYMVYSAIGTLTNAYNMLTVNGAAQTYNATISYSSNGGYSVAWQGIFDTDGDQNTTADQTVGKKSETFYGPSGRTLKETSYAKDGTSDGYTTYNYDNAGNMASDTTYAKNSAGVMTLSSVGTYEAGKKTSITTYNENGSSYVSAVYNYSGNKLASISYYEPSDATAATTTATAANTQGASLSTKLSSTLYFDSHGRQSYTTDSLGRTLTTYNWNDTNATVNESITNNGTVYTTNVVAGGLLSTNTKTYYSDNNSTFYKETKTLYMAGNSNSPYITATVGDTAATYVASNINTNATYQSAQILAATGDPTVTGAISINSAGVVQMTVTTQAGFNAMIAGLDAAISGASAFSGNADSISHVFSSIRAAITAQWNSTGHVTLNVGAISASGISGTNQTGHATRVNYLSNQNADLMANIVGQSGGQATLTWDYWNIDSSGNVWAFANNVQNASN